VVNTAFMMGGALGLAVLASLAAARTTALAGAGADALVALNGGYQLAFVIGAVFAAAAAVLGALLLRGAQHQDGLAVAELVLDEFHGVAVLRQRRDRFGAVGQHQAVEQEAGLVLQRGIGVHACRPSAVGSMPMRGPTSRGRPRLAPPAPPALVAAPRP
jgi:hypothetical protein